MMIFWLSYVVLWAVAICQLFAIIVVAQRLFQQGREREGALAPSGSLPAGVSAPAFAAARVGSATPVNSLELRGAETFLLFLSVDCPECRRISAGLEDTKPFFLSGLVIHCAGSPAACERRFAALSKVVPVLINAEIDVAKAFGLSGVPTGVTVDSEWRIREYHYPSSAAGVLDILKGLSRESGAESPALSVNWK